MKKNEKKYEELVDNAVNRPCDEAPKNDFVKCCLCGKKILMNRSNNPYPVRTGNKRCCNECNERLVIPIRFAAMMAKDRGMPQKDIEGRLKSIQRTPYDYLLLMFPSYSSKK